MKNNILYAAVSMGLFGLISFALAQSVTIPNPLGDVNDFNTLLLKIAYSVGMLIGVIGIIMIMIAGILYLTSAGSPEKMTTAKKALTYAVIGIIVGLAATTIVNIILGILSGTG